MFPARCLSFRLASFGAKAQTFPAPCGILSASRKRSAVTGSDDIGISYILILINEFVLLRFALTITTARQHGTAADREIDP